MKEKLVEKLFNGTCTPEELKSLLTIIRKDPSPPDTKLMEKLWEEAQGYPKLKEDTFGRFFSKTLDKIKTHEKSKTHVFAIWNRNMDTKRLVGVAASFLILMLAGVWFLVIEQASQVVQTSFGERQTFKLNDGSKVQLNANSRLAFDKNWEVKDSREVFLKGEAFFEVKKKPRSNQKFQVVTNDLTIEVLGTSFNVKNLAEETSVYLEEGAIRLYLNALDSTILMKQGDLVTYSQVTHKITRKRQEQAALHTSWKEGVLTFRDTPLHEVLQKIEDIYGINFKVAHQGDNYLKISFPLPINELDTAILILEKTIGGLEVRKENELYIIDRLNKN